MYDFFAANSDCMLIPWNTAKYGQEGDHWVGVLVDFQKRVVALSDPLLSQHPNIIEDVKWMLQLHVRSANINVQCCNKQFVATFVIIQHLLCMHILDYDSHSMRANVTWICINRHIGKSKHSRKAWSRTSVDKTLQDLIEQWRFVHLPELFVIRQTDNFSCGIIMILTMWYQALNMQPMSEYSIGKLYGCVPDQAFFVQVRRWFTVILASNGNVWGSKNNRMEWNCDQTCTEPFRLDLGQNLSDDFGSTLKCGLGYCPPASRPIPSAIQRPVLFTPDVRTPVATQPRNRKKKQ